MSTDQLAADETLMAYLAARDQARANATRATWDAMTHTEKRLFREAAVMGYLQGMWDHGNHDAKIPPDRVVVTAVIAAIHAFDDLYPFTAGLTRRRGRNTASTDPASGQE